MPEGVRYLKINPIRELLRAGRIVGLRPREMTLIALERLAEEAEHIDGRDDAR